MKPHPKPKTKRGGRKPTEWLKNRFRGKLEPWFIDGDVFIIAVLVKNSSTGVESWQIDKVVADCDGEQLHLKTPEGETYDDWQWMDVDYYIPVDATGPMTGKQIEGFL